MLEQHNITSTDKISLVKRKAWHGLGDVIEEGESIRDVAERTLDWEVYRRPLQYTTNVGIAVSCPGFALVRGGRNPSDDTVLATVSDNYVECKNSTLITLAERFEEQSQGRVKLETVGSIRGGKQVWILAKVGDGYSPIEGDENHTYLGLFNGHDGKHGLRVIGTGVRVVCNNTIRMALGSNKGGITIRHDSGLPQAVMGLLDSLDEFGKVQADHIEEDRALVRREVSKEKAGDLVANYVLRAYPNLVPTDRDKAFQLVDRIGDAHASEPLGEGTLWGVYNAMTFVEDHNLNGKLSSAASRIAGAKSSRKSIARELVLGAL